jgi:hypothetical protein
MVNNFVMLYKASFRLLFFTKYFSWKFVFSLCRKCWWKKIELTSKRTWVACLSKV